MQKNKLYSILAEEKIFNTHCHHLPDEQQSGLGLTQILQNSYLNWCGRPIPAPDREKEQADFLQAVGSRSFFIWLEKALMDLFASKDQLTPASWANYDLLIQKAHQDEAWHLKVLTEKCHYETILLDPYWQLFSDNGHPQLFKPVYRINSIFYGYNQDVQDHNGNNFQVQQNVNIKDIRSYTDLVNQVVRAKHSSGCRVLKCALAYDRPLNFQAGQLELAQDAFAKNPATAAILAFHDYIFDYICQLAAELGLVVQIHTGLGLMTGSNAMQLQDLIARHPATKFWLMHGSYPWISDIAGLVSNYDNVWADLSWLPLISPTAGRTLLHELIEVANADRVVWGCDTWTSVESYAARLAFLDLLADVLSTRLEAGLMQPAAAWQYARGVLYENAATSLGYL